VVSQSAASLREQVRQLMYEMLPLKMAQVSAVGEDGTVNLQFGGGIIEQVPCGSGYPTRTIGDSVLVIRPLSGNWMVLAKTTSGEMSEFATKDDLEAAVTDLSDDLAPDVTASFGSAAPGAGWTPATTVWFRDNGAGGRDLYLQNATPPASTPKPPAKTAPKTVTLQPSAEGAWRSGGQTDDIPWQGDWTGRGNWHGGWFYGTAIEDACDGRSVKSMVLRLSRSGNGQGWNRVVPVNLGLHNRTTKGNPSIAVGPKVPFKLEPNQARDYTLPTSWRDQLAAGTMRGFTVSGSGQGDYLKFGGASGRLVISFNAI
jgi:hypothetical protein